MLGKHKEILTIACLLMFVFAGLSAMAFFKNKNSRVPWLEITSVSVFSMVGLILLVLVLKIDAKIPEPGEHNALGSASYLSNKSTPPPPPIQSGPTKDEQINAKLLRRAEKGDATSQYDLGARYESGEGLNTDNKIAVDWYKKAAVANSKPAETRLGVLYKKGIQGEPDYGQALKWLTKAANQKYAPAEYQLGLMYEFGEGTPKNYHKAADWYGQAVTQNDSYAQYRLGLLNLSGSGVAANVEKAVKLITASATHHNWHADLKLSDMFAKGIGVEKSAQQSTYWAKLAETDKRPPTPGNDEWLHETIEDQVTTPNRTDNVRPSGSSKSTNSRQSNSGKQP